MKTDGNKRYSVLQAVAWQCGVLAVLALCAVGGWLIAQGRLVPGTGTVVIAVGVLVILWRAHSDATKDAVDRLRKFITEIIWWLPS